MKQGQDNSNSGSKASDFSLKGIFSASPSSFEQPTRQNSFAIQQQTAHGTRVDHEQVIQKVEAQKKAFEMTFRFFCFQVVNSSVANIFGTVIGHPLDTIRVRMQVDAKRATFLRTCAETYRGEGVRGFFKGLVSPVVGVTPYNAMVFTVTEIVKNQLTNKYGDSISDENKSFIAGSIAGANAIVIYNPVELLKVRAQVNRIETVKYRQAIPELLRSEGFTGLYKGSMALVFRDVPGWGVYFWTYEFLKKAFKIPEAKKNGEQFKGVNAAIMMWCAGVAGQASWIVSYPFDIIKTHIQCNEVRRVPLKEAVAHIYGQQGLTGFFKGLHPTLMRSFVVNGLTLPAFEYLNDKYCYGNNCSEKKND